jgi:hypothetical protein
MYSSSRNLFKSLIESFSHLFKARLKSHGLSGTEVHYKDLSNALKTLDINVAAMPFYVQEKFVGALSRNPKTFIISIPLFLSIYRFWCLNWLRIDRLSLDPGDPRTNTNIHNGRHVELVGAVESILSPLLCFLTTEARNGEISETLFSSALKRCGLILSYEDARSIWLYILMANSYLRAEEIEYRENFISCVIISHEDVIRSFNPQVKHTVNRRHHAEPRLPAPDSVIGAIQRDVPAPLMRRSVAHRQSSIPLVLGTLPQESPIERGSVSVPLRYRNTSLHTSNAAWENDNKVSISNTRRRVLSNLEGMDYDRKVWFVQLLLKGAKEVSNGYKTLDSVNLYDALSKAGTRLRPNEKEEFWSEILSTCRPLSEGGRAGPRDASVVEFIFWIGLGDVHSAAQSIQELDDVIHSRMATADVREPDYASDEAYDRGDDRGSLRGMSQPVYESFPDVEDAPDTPDSLSERGDRYSAMDRHDHARGTVKGPLNANWFDNERNTVPQSTMGRYNTPPRPATSSSVSDLLRAKPVSTSLSADFSNIQQLGRRQMRNNFGGNQLRGESVSSLFAAAASAYRDDDTINGVRDGRRQYQNSAVEVEVGLVQRDGIPGESQVEGLTMETRVAIVNELQSKIALIALTFRQLIGESRLKIGDKKVTCDDFARAIRSPPLSILITPDISRHLTRDILKLPPDCDTSKVAISYSDVTRYLEDNRYKYTVSAKEASTGKRTAHHTDSRYLTQVQTDISVEIEDESTRQAHRIMAMERSILQKMAESDSIRRDRIRLLALTPLLRTRLRKQLNQGANGHSWDSSMDRCTAQEMTKLFQTADVAFSVEEGQHIQAVCASAHPDSTHSRSTPGFEILLSDVILYLSELIARHAPKLH